MTKLLWISYCAPYKQVPHAGGKNHYYWLKKVEEDHSFEIKLITCCEYDGYSEFQKEDYSFDTHCCVASNSTLGKLRQKLQSLLLAPYSIVRFAGCVAMYKISYVKKTVKMLKKQGYTPDTILLQWTQMGFLYDWIRKLYPTARLILMEEDVSFLRTKRELEASKGFSRITKKIVHKVMYTRELTMCNEVAHVIVNNRKDAALLVENGIAEDKILYTVPYYYNLSDVTSGKGSKKILFYGAMNRKENIDAVLWFAKDILPKLREIAPFEFVILGGNPVEEIRKLANDYIEVTGFVDDIRPYFQDALCLAAPLFSGAGIKIKILEGMSSGIPVLTNDIGIEGIMAEDGTDYCHCNTAEDYVSAISKLYEDVAFATMIGENGRRLVSEKFNVENSVEQFREILKSC